MFHQLMLPTKPKDHPSKTKHLTNSKVKFYSGVGLMSFVVSLTKDHEFYWPDWCSSPYEGFWKIDEAFCVQF